MSSIYYENSDAMEEDGRKPLTKKASSCNEPAVPISGYNYKRYLAEAKVFYKNATSAQVLYQLQKEILSSKSYDKYFRKEKVEKEREELLIMDDSLS